MRMILLSSILLGLWVLILRQEPVVIEVVQARSRWWSSNTSQFSKKGFSEFNSILMTSVSWLFGSNYTQVSVSEAHKH